VEEVAVVERLQAEELEEAIALGIQCGSEAGKIEVAQFLVEDLQLDGFVDEGGEVLFIAKVAVLLRAGDDAGENEG